MKIPGITQPEAAAPEAPAENRVDATSAAELQEKLGDIFSRLTESAPEVDESAPAAEVEAPQPETPESDTEPPADPETPDEDEDGLDADEVKGISAETQERINRRIGKLTAKRKAAEETAKDAVARAELAEQRATELEAKVNDGTVAGAYQLGIAPGYATQAELDLMKQDQELAAAEGWLLEHFEGYEDPEGGKSYTGEQVRKRYVEVSQQRRTLAPKAQAVRDRAAAQQLQDMELGRQIREGKKTVVDKAAPRTAPRTTTPPPALPGRSTASAAPPVGLRRPPKGFHIEGEVSRDSLANALANVL